ncbi:MAG: hypothetical protein Q8M08_03240 [Bacteroidales bacterium]|nr:hypothetical protein [Bacteroidales bacterium]
MRIVVNDANILIDLVKLQLLPHFFGLGWEYHTTSLIFEELFENQREAFAPYQDNGLFIVADLDAEELGAILNYKKRSFSYRSKIVQLYSTPLKHQVFF